MEHVHVGVRGKVSAIPQEPGVGSKASEALGGKPFSTLMYSTTLVMKFWLGEKTLNIMLRGSAPKVVGCRRNCERYGP